MNEYVLKEGVTLSATSDIYSYGTDDYICTLENERGRHVGLRIRKNVFEQYFGVASSDTKDKDTETE